MKRVKIVFGLLLLLLVFSGFSSNTVAVTNNNGFSLQVTPSPLISTIDPGKETSLEMKVRNGNTVAEDLKMELRAFNVDKTTGEIKISDQTADNVKDFVTFEQDSFHIEAGQWYTQKVHVNTPKDAGFSYNFVILISRKTPTPKVEGVSNIEGSVAVFTLLNVNRPDATKKLELASFASARKSYEYLPADFELTVKNSGNTIIQPKGNIFIGRTGNEQHPLSVQQINVGGGYVIPDSTRVLKTQWSEGFPSRGDKGKMVWDWSKLNKLRIGKYTAKAILIYDDGQRDIPIETSVTFWVWPWKLMLGALLIALVLLTGLYAIFRKAFGVVSVRKGKPAEPEA